MENRSIRDDDESGGAGDAPSSGNSKSPLPLCLSPSVGDGAREEFIRSFQETLAENLMLRQAIRDKADQIVNLKSKLLDMLEKHRDEDQIMEFNTSLSYLEQTEEILATCTNNPEYSAAHEENNVSRILDESRALATTFSESMIEWVEDNKDEVLDKFGKGSFHLTEFAAGYLGGWLAAFALKTFGKIAVTALGGGLLLMQWAHYKGYIVVKWSEIFDEIQDKLDTTAAVLLPEPKTPTADEPRENELEAVPRTGNRFDFLQRWSVNAFSITGFVGGFLYKSCS